MVVGIYVEARAGFNIHSELYLELFHETAWTWTWILVIRTYGAHSVIRTLRTLYYIAFTVLRCPYSHSFWTFSSHYSSNFVTIYFIYASLLLRTILVYSQVIKFRPNTLFALVFFPLALVIVLLALKVFLFAFEFLLSCTPFSDQTVHDIKTVHVLGVAALPFLDLRHQARKLAVFPPEPLHVPSNLFLRAKARVCSGPCFEIRKADVLAAIPL